MFREVAVKVMEFRRVLLSMVVFSALVVAGCGSGGGANQPPPAPTTDIGVSSSSSLGNYLVSSSGRTLYYFGLDLPAAGAVAPVSNCAGSCVAVWPIFHVDSPTLAAGLSASDFGELIRADGTKQTTFKGWPLYFYAGDSKAGDTNGDNLTDFGPWYVIRDPFYSALVLTKAGGPSIYLADPAARTLYVFSQDTVGTASAAPVSACTDACLTHWPIFRAGSNTVPTGVDPAKLTTFARPDGAMQSAFDGHPLYFFAGDSAPGDDNGRGVNGRDTVDPVHL